MWTILYSGQEQTLADWGIDDVAFEFPSMGVDVCTLKCSGLEIDALELFLLDAVVQIYQNRVQAADGSFSGGQRWFYGCAQPWSRDGDIQGESHTGKLVGPWWWLTKQIYQQTFERALDNGKGGTTLLKYTSKRVVLNATFNTSDPTLPDYSPTGSLTTGQQIISALNWAISRGAPIQIGHMAPWALPASSFQRVITCEAVIQMMHRIEPDFTVHWDYTTNPYPTVHFLKSSNQNLDPGFQPADQAALILTPVVLDLNAANLIEKVNIRERQDWQVSYVSIDWQYQLQINSLTYLGIFTEWYSALGYGSNTLANSAPLPNDAVSNVRGVDLFFDMGGSTAGATSEMAEITTQVFGINDIATWSRWKTELSDATMVSAVLITAANTDNAALHPAPWVEGLDVDANGQAIQWDAQHTFELTGGSYHDWLQAAEGITAQNVRANCWIKYTLKNGHSGYRKVSKELTALNLDTASQPVQFTVTSSSLTPGEPFPVGLPQMLYKAMRALAIEGTISTLETEVTGNINRGNCLNFLPSGDKDWSAVNAPVQSLSGSLKSGTTNISFGAPLHLTANDLVELVRVSRFRFTSINFAYIFGGWLQNGGGTVRHPHRQPNRSIQHGADQTTTLVVSGSANPGPQDAIFITDGNTGVSTWTPPAAPQANGLAQPTVVVDPSKAKGSDGQWHSLQLVEKKECVNIGGVLKQRTVLVLASDTYQGAGDPA